jgi:hypothetical protein
VRASVDDVVLFGRCHHPGVLPTQTVEGREQIAERRTRIGAPAAPATHVEHAAHFDARIGLVEVCRMLRVVRRRHCPSL